MSDTSDSKTTCARKCYENSSCGGFEYRDAGSNKCRFKSTSCTQSEALTFTSQSSKACSSGQGLGADNKSLDQCKEACKTNSNCIGFVYANHGHKCRLKRSCSVTSVGPHRTWYSINGNRQSYYSKNR